MSQNNCPPAAATPCPQSLVTQIWLAIDKCRADVRDDRENWPHYAQAFIALAEEANSVLASHGIDKPVRGSPECFADLSYMTTRYLRALDGC